MFNVVKILSGVFDLDISKPNRRQEQNIKDICLSNLTLTLIYMLAMNILIALPFSGVNLEATSFDDLRAL